MVANSKVNIMWIIGRWDFPVGGMVLTQILNRCIINITIGRAVAYGFVTVGTAPRGRAAYSTLLSRGGGTATAMHAHHRVSPDVDSVLSDLRHRFYVVLGQLESLGGRHGVYVPRS